MDEDKGGLKLGLASNHEYELVVLKTGDRYVPLLTASATPALREVCARHATEQRLSSGIET